MTEYSFALDWTKAALVFGSLVVVAILVLDVIGWWVVYRD